MHHTTRIMSTLALIGLASSCCRAIERQAADTNAALEYYRASHLASEDLGKDSIDTSGDRITLTKEWKTKSNGTMLFNGVEILHDASKLDHIDWGFESSEGPGTLLPHLGMMRNFARYLAADAIYHDEFWNDPDRSIENLATMHRMSTQVSNDGILIGSLVGIAINNLSIQLTNQFIDDEIVTSHNAQIIIDSINLQESEDRFAMRDSIIGEWRMIGEFIMTDAPEDNPGQWLMDQVGFATDTPESKRILRMSRKELIQELGGYAVYHSDILRAFDAQDMKMFETAEDLLQDNIYGDLATILAPSFTRAFASNLQANEELNELITRLENLINE